MTRRVLVLGSGGLRVGQGGEFDYAGVQAVKALRAAGVEVSLLNPNVASVQASAGFADRLHLLPVEPEVASRIIAADAIDGLLAGFGGQTALNCALALSERGVLERHGVRLLGTPIEALRATEDRSAFACVLAELGLPGVRQAVVAGAGDIEGALRAIGAPAIVRAAYALGGQDAALLADEAAIARALVAALAAGGPVYLEESVAGWKEIELEVVRDALDQCVVVCALENLDPVGIHTGDSIVVAPCLTLPDGQLQGLRDAALRLVRRLGIVGACNVQFALNADSGETRVIEANARLSRSSALASKATGYPIAHVAARVALGDPLHRIALPGGPTLTAFYEPALDYVACKVPRWDLTKFPGTDDGLGPAMKAVGEVMGLGRGFLEALQAALRMACPAGLGLANPSLGGHALPAAIGRPWPGRLQAVARALAEGWTVEALASRTAIAPYFLHELARAQAGLAALGRAGGIEGLDRDELARLKRDGWADAAIARALGSDEATVRARREAWGLVPDWPPIDPTGGEHDVVPASTFPTYAAAPAVGPPAGQAGTGRPKLLIVGPGGYRIGASVEFDWCCVHAADEARALGWDAVVLNGNPATASTDPDAVAGVVFAEAAPEPLLAWCRRERPAGVILALGGQPAIDMATPLAAAGIPLLGPSAEAIARAEDRARFAELCGALGIAQPAWVAVRPGEDPAEAARAIGGFPVVVRPSHVLGGVAMALAHDPRALAVAIARAATASPGGTIVLSRFAADARELELDAVAVDGVIRWSAACVHLEAAGVHSGDATLIHPPLGVPADACAEIERIAAALADALTITGPFNLQLLLGPTGVQVLECNLRASRTFPFVSAATGANFARAAARALLRAPLPAPPAPSSRFAVKAPQLSGRWLGGAAPPPGPAMTATGEAAAIAEDPGVALLLAHAATGLRLPVRAILIAPGAALDGVRGAEAWPSVEASLAALIACGVPVHRPADARAAIEMLAAGGIDLVVAPIAPGAATDPDRELVMRATARGIHLVRDARLAAALFGALAARPGDAGELSSLPAAASSDRRAAR